MPLSLSKRANLIVESDIRAMTIECDRVGGINLAQGVCDTDMGEPVRIDDSAENMIRLIGFQPGRDIPIEVIGLRQGERLNETLVMDGEKLLTTEHEKVFKVQGPRFGVKKKGSTF